jgi:hypothetical protein
MPLLTERELRARVTRLAAIERPSASAGEHRAAELIRSELRAAGFEARLEQERAHGTYWWPLGIATGGAALAAMSRSRLAPALAGFAGAAAAADDIRVGRRPLRRLLARRQATNVIAEAGPPDAARTVVFVAHHDAAHSGLVFHPDLPRSLGRRFPALLERTNTTPPTMWPAVGAPLLIGLGALLGLRRLRRAGLALSAAFALAMADIGVRRAVPGANDNLSGVAVLLSLAQALRDTPAAGVRVLLVSTGSEESLMEGMEGFARRHFATLRRESTWFVCVDTVGSPHLVLLEGEGMLGIREYPKDFLRLLHGCAGEMGVELRRGLRFRNATDGLLPLEAGYPTAALVSVDELKIPTNYHWPTDTPDRVDYHTVADAARVCEALVRRLAAVSPPGPRARSSRGRARSPGAARTQQPAEDCQPP